MHPTRGGHTVGHLAAYAGNVETLKCLLTHAQVPADTILNSIGKQDGQYSLFATHAPIPVAVTCPHSPSRVH